MNLKDRDGDELLASICDSIHCEDETFFNEVKTELLSRLEAGAKAIEAMEQIVTLWQSNLTQDEFDKQLVLILLKYRENN